MRLWTAAAIIAAVVIGSFILSVPRATDVARAPGLSTATTTPAVTLRDTYRKGVHTIAGTVTAPNACGHASAESTLASSTNSIMVAISLAVDDGVCLQLSTPISFSTTVTAPAHLPLTATVNGAVASTTVL